MAILFIDVIDFSKPFYGNGQASIATSALRAFGEKIYLVGPTSGDQRIGKWTTIDFSGKRINFLPVITYHDLTHSKLKSDNVRLALALIEYSKAIESVCIKSVFTRVYTVLWWLTFSSKRWDICFYYPGLGNPLKIGRKQRVGKWLAPFYEVIQGLAIRTVSAAFAAAPQDQVDRYMLFLHKLGIRKKILSLPTAVNLDIFKPLPRNEAREVLSLPLENKIFTYVGRLASIKGLPFLFEALKEVCKVHPDAILIVVGSGEEKDNLHKLALEMGLMHNIHFLGLLPPEKVSLAISSADACVVGSYVEGFSNAMVEQISCGRPIISTNVSGAESIIIENRNGFIVRERNPELFARRMIDALNLKDAERISRQIAIEKFSEEKLWNSVQETWPALRS
jgi:glycosyltransferase involved in cell wall biosynthesis